MPALIARAPQLKVVANHRRRNNNIDVAACNARGIMATNTPGVLDDSTADLAWTLMLGAARRITEVERYIRQGDWRGWRLKQWLGTDVHHATLGIVGMGRIGQAIARRASGFEMRVLYHNRKRVAEEIERKLGASWASFESYSPIGLFVLQVPYSPRRTIDRAASREDEADCDPDQNPRGGLVETSRSSGAEEGTIRAQGRRFRERRKSEPRFSRSKTSARAAHGSGRRRHAAQGPDCGEKTRGSAQRRHAAELSPQASKA